MLFLLNTTQVIDDGKNAFSHDDFRVLLRTGQLPVGRIDTVRQADDGVESFPPDRHFTIAVRRDGFRSIDRLVNGVRGKCPVAFPGQDRQIGRRDLELLGDGSFALAFSTMAARAGRLKC